MTETYKLSHLISCESKIRSILPTIPNEKIQSNMKFTSIFTAAFLGVATAHTVFYCIYRALEEPKDSIVNRFSGEVISGVSYAAVAIAIIILLQIAIRIAFDLWSWCSCKRKAATQQEGAKQEHPSDDSKTADNV
eukprot:scaffold9435_cov137-Cylindrotheca_fusiformis.AAC.2